MNKVLPVLLSLLVLASCQNANDRRVVRYPDAVLSLNQVDPAYRAYFRDQQGANFGVDEQRAALAAAAKTASTPVPSSMPARLASTNKSTARRAVAVKGKTTAKGRAVAAKGKTTAKGRAVAAKGKSAAKGRAVAAKGKSAAKGKAVAVAKKPSGKRKQS